MEQALPAPVARRLEDLPGPRGWPLVGNLLQMKPRQVHQSVEEWSRIHGPLFRMTLGRTDVLAVADHELVTQVLRERPGTFRRPTILSELSGEMGGVPGVFEAEGAAWRNQRRMVMQAFAPQAVKAYFPSLVTVAGRLRRRWESAAAKGQALDLGAELRLYTVDVIAGLAFGSDVNSIETGDNAIQRDMDDILSAIARRSMSPFPYWRYVKLAQDRRVDEAALALRRAVEELIKAAKERLATDPARAQQPPNMLEAMLAAAAQPDSGVSEVDVAGNVLTMLLAGEDTTSNALAWLIYLLQRHPQALAKARAEVLRVVPDPAAMTIVEADALDYLGACTEEAMRLKPPAPYIPVEALHETTVGGVLVPQGTIVWCVLRKPEQEGVFSPERWLDQHADAAGRPRASMPFGAGPRTCPGRYLALLEIKVAMAMLLSSFDIVSVTARSGAEPVERMGFVMAPEPLALKLNLRL